MKVDVGEAFHVETAFAGRVRAEPFEQSAVPVGEAADMVKLPLHYQYCLAHGRKPVAPACLNG